MGGSNCDDFYPRSPCGERLAPKQNATEQRNFYPRSPCGERLENTLCQIVDRRISIHALLAESDSWPPCRPCCRMHFYPRSPCGERRRPCANSPQAAYFYPRSPCGERRRPCANSPQAAYFYPRSPCGERRAARWKNPVPATFLSTLSLRRATPASMRGGPGLIYFYPRSPCGERHPQHIKHVSHLLNFYPRSPCGERPITIACKAESFKFLSTLSLRRATNQENQSERYERSFLSTLSLRRATLGDGRTIRITGISIHALLAESDSSA